MVQSYSHNSICRCSFALLAQSEINAHVLIIFGVMCLILGTVTDCLLVVSFLTIGLILVMMRMKIIIRIFLNFGSLCFLCISLLGSRYFCNSLLIFRLVIILQFIHFQIIL